MEILPVEKQILGLVFKVPPRDDDGFRAHVLELPCRVLHRLVRLHALASKKCGLIEVGSYNTREREKPFSHGIKRSLLLKARSRRRYRHGVYHKVFKLVSLYHLLYDLNRVDGI